MPDLGTAQHTIPSVCISFFDPGSAKRILTTVSRGGGAEVRIAMPLRLRFNDNAAVILVPMRYDTAMPSTTRGLSRRLKLSGNR